MNVWIVNRAAVCGGQERYLTLLAGELSRSGARLSGFEGGPSQVERAICALMARTQEPADVVFYNGNRALYDTLLSRRRAKTAIYVQHSLVSDAQAGRVKCSVRQVLLRMALARVDAAIRVCDVALPASWKPGAITTVHNGVDIEQWPCRSSWRDDPEAMFTMVMVGAVTVNKNQRLAIEALARLPRARLVIVGEGPARVAGEEVAASLGVAHRITWVGSQADPAPYYREADICLMLSRFEAMPFVVLEAMASGTPVVAVPVGGVPDVVDHGVDGIMIEAGSVSALVGAVQELEANPARLRELGRRARAKIEARFTTEHMARGVLGVVERARQQNRRRGAP